MKLRVLLLGALALTLLLVACAPPPELRDSTLLNDDSLLTDDPCSAPCWRNITPGETSWSEALTIIEDDVRLSDPQLQESEEDDAVVATFRQAEGNDCCQIFSEDGQTVGLLFLRLAAPNVTLGELLDAKGEPAYVLGSEFSEDQSIMNLIYPDIPMVTYAFVAGPEGALNEGSEIIGALYMQNSDMELLIQTSNLQAWEGFQSYNAYQESEFEVTPAVTLTPTPAS